MNKSRFFEQKKRFSIYVRRKALQKVTAEIEKVLIERFGKDSLISLATAVEHMPYVRTVDAYYDSGSFYVLTHALSNKMKQIRANPNVAIAGAWFTAKGKGIELGYFRREENKNQAQQRDSGRRQQVDRNRFYGISRAAIGASPAHSPKQKRRSKA